MKIVNINDIEAVVLAKYEIENYKLQNKEIEEKEELGLFLQNLTKSIYSLSTKGFSNVINFAIIKNPNETYLFVLNEDPNELKTLESNLKAIDYDMSKTTKFNVHAGFMKDNLPDFFFIQGQNYYKI